jgi:DNA-binding transcriptional ArsR family regulator
VDLAKPKGEVMSEAEGMAAFAALLADRTRAAMCLALLDGRAWTAGELGRAAGVAPATASEHLDRLVRGGLLAQERQGRHRYVRLAGPEVAHLVEELSAHSQGEKPAVRTLRAAAASEAMTRARTCYDHLAGRLGVAISDAMDARGLVARDAGLALTGDGLAWLAGLGASLPAGRRPVVRECLDWTEPRPHLAGATGAALCARAFDLGWIVRIGSGRAVKVTPDGSRGFADALGLTLT